MSSLGWLAQTSLVKKAGKPIQVDKDSMLDLQAALFQKELELSRKGGSESSRKKATPLVLKQRESTKRNEKVRERESYVRDASKRHEESL